MKKYEEKNVFGMCHYYLLENLVGFAESHERAC